jgi:hypothetical protein
MVAISLHAAATPESLEEAVRLFKFLTSTSSDLHSCGLRRRVCRFT